MTEHQRDLIDLLGAFEPKDSEGIANFGSLVGRNIIDEITNQGLAEEDWGFDWHATISAWYKQDQGEV